MNQPKPFSTRKPMSDQPLTVLFLCTGNSCRSIMAEAILNKLADGKMHAYSAGSRPTGQVHPIALTCLNHNRTPVDHPRSQSWDEFIDQHIDLVVTVCDNAAGEACPAFPGNPRKLHWGLPDPATATGSPDEVFAQFQAVYKQLHELITELLRAFDERGSDGVDDWLEHARFAHLLPGSTR
jgi:arsenate reductase